MSVVYNIIFSCLIAAEAVHSVQQNRVVAIIDLYHKTLNFFDYFLLPDEVQNLPEMAENLPLKTHLFVGKAEISYWDFHSKIEAFCRVIKVYARVYAGLGTVERLASETQGALNNMKECFDSILTNGGKKKNVENYQAVITFTDGVLKYEVIKGHTPDEIEDIVQPLFHRSKSEGNVTLTTFIDKVNYAKNIITEALGVINGTTINALNKEDLENMAPKCRPFMDFWNNGTIWKSTSPPPTITPSKKDFLMKFSPSCCDRLFPKIAEEYCVAVLSKQTVMQMLDFRRHYDSVRNFFNAITHLSSSAECKEYMTSFIHTETVYWVGKAREMNDEQFLKLCLEYGKNIKTTGVTIVN